VGNRFIWGKSPQNEQAIDLMYRATYSPDSDIRHYAEYFGLSVVEHKDTQILKRLAQLCVNYKETDTGRIIWGVYMSDQQHEFMSELKPYLEKYGSEIYRRADYVAKAVRGEIPVDELQETYRKNWNRKQTADPSFSPAGQAEGESDLEVLDIDFEPIHQGKNVVRVKVKNKSGEEQVFGIHIYTRSVDYGPQGVGWGRVFFDKIEAGETKTVTSPFHIQGPVTKNTWLRLKFYNPESIETYDYEKPFQQKRFASGDLERQQVMATAEELNQLSKALEVIKAYIRDGEYKNAWQLFTEDYQQVQFGRDGLERFEQAMEPTHPIDSAFWWEREDFLSLKPLEAIYTDGTYKLTAQSLKGEAWTIDFVKEDEVWKIDWIAGYRPAILDIQEADRFRELLEEAVSVDIDHSPGSDRLSVQYAVMAICEAAGVPYQWDKSAELADQQQRQYTEPVHIKDVPAKDALADILGPFGLSYSLDEAGLYLHKTDSEAKETVKVGKADKLAAENLTAESRMVSQNPVGRWRSVDFVREMEEFEPGVKSWPGDLYLKDLEFMKDGRTSGPCTWKKGSLWHPGDRTKAKYVIKEIDGVKYLFMEWISGDVTKRGRKPWYYVLKRVD
jgi:hypothetical protein